MTRSAQNLLLLLLGAAIGWITLFTDEYLNYVRPGFRPPLLGAAAVLVVLGAAGLRREWRTDARAEPGAARHGEGHGGHEHHGGHGPRVAWLLCLPALAVFLIAPPALGSFTADRDTGRRAAPPPPPAEGYGMLRSTGDPIDMTMGEFIGRSFETQTGRPNGLDGTPVRLTGFVSARGAGGWYLTRLKMACCAGDAIPFRVVVRGLPKPATDAWVQVVGTWAGPASRRGTMDHGLRARHIRPIAKPKKTYE